MCQIQRPHPTYVEYEGCARQPDSHIVIVSTFKLCEAKAKQGVDSLCSNVANQKPEKHPNWTEQVQLMEETDCAYCHDEGKSFLEEGRFVYEDVTEEPEGMKTVISNPNPE